MMNADPTRQVSILVFDEIEVLDLAGPFEVFSVASRVALRKGAASAPFEVSLVADRPRTIRARGNFNVNAHTGIANVESTSLLLVPGGIVDQPLADSTIIDWVRTLSRKAEITASVCTGAFILAKAGLLAGLKATTHWEDAEELARHYPDIDVTCGGSWVDQGDVVTSAGISAGIDMSLHVVRRLLGREMALATARQMEYRWADEAG